MHDHIAAILQRALTAGRREGAVHHREDAPRLRERDRGPQVLDPQQRIGRGFEPEHFCLGTNRLLDRAGIGAVHERYLQAGAAAAHLAEDAKRAAVAVHGRDHVRAGIQQLQRGGRGGHAGRKG